MHSGPRWGAAAGAMITPIGGGAGGAVGQYRGRVVGVVGDLLQRERWSGSVQNFSAGSALNTEAIFF